MLKINIENLAFNCIIGILPIERKKKQKVIINVSFEYFYTKSNFIDYSKITKFIERTMIKKEFKLIEDAIIFIRKKLNSKYDIKNLKLKISKPNILPNCIVSVEE